MGFNKNIHRCASGKFAFWLLLSVCVRFFDDCTSGSYNGKQKPCAVESPSFLSAEMEQLVAGQLLRLREETDIGAASLVTVSADTLFHGQLICHQPVAGYRFSVDSILLAHFLQPAAGIKALDLGCGCGIVSLILAYRCPDVLVCGLEVQEELFAIARRNVEYNSMLVNMQVMHGDVRAMAKSVSPESFDLVLCNPPYFSPGRGRLNQQSQVAQARHAQSGSLEDFIAAAAFAVKNKGKVVFVFAASGQAQLQELMLAKGLTPKELQIIYSFPEDCQGRLVLVKAIKNGGVGCRVLPPFYIYTASGGNYSKPMQQLYKEGRCWPRC
jgi:tRNA1Val (adenine37-N6)-methyltransferase